MADENDRNSGLQEAHTPAENSGAAARSGGGSDEAAAIEPDPERVAKVGATRAMTEAAMKDLGEQLAGGGDEAEQPSLLLDEADEQLALFAGPVRHVAETINAARAGRGRPKGSKNKANAEFRDTLMRMGYRHPGLNLAALANADPVDLARELSIEERDKNGVLWRVGCTPKEAMDLILKANAELLPYFESKAPTKNELAVDAPMGVMVIGEMNIEVTRDEKTIDLTRFDVPAEKSE